MPAKPPKEPELTDREVAERMDKALRRSFAIPHKPHVRKPEKRKRAKSKSRKDLNK